MKDNKRAAGENGRGTGYSRDRQKEHFEGIDLMKGILIIMVFWINTIRATQYDSVSKYVLVTVTMPVFIGISGFLVKEDFMRKARFLDVIKKYVTSHVLEVYRAVREGIPNLFSKS